MRDPTDTVKRWPIAAAYGLALMLLAMALLGLEGMWASQPTVQAVEGPYTYYGYVPDRIWSIIATHYSGSQADRFDVSNGSIRDHGYVNILGNHDATSVTVYSLADRREVASLRLNRLEEATVTLPNATFFKVVADKPVTVTLMGGGSVEARDGLFSAYYTSVDGGYVGKEFIFKPLLGTLSGLATTVYALQPSEVTIYDANGSQVTAFRLDANEYRDLSFTPYANYRLVSSGYVILETFTMGSPCFYPSVQGSFVGTVIYGSSGAAEEWGGSQNFPFFYRIAVITATEDTKATVLDDEYKKVNAELNVVGGRNNSVEMKLTHVVVQSEKPIALMYKSDSYVEPGIAFTGLKAGQSAGFYLPPGGGYLFTAEQTRIELDGTSFTLPADSVQPLERGFHTLSADRNVVIEAINLSDELPATLVLPPGKTTGIGNFAAVMPSVQSLSLTYPDLSLKPVIAEGLPLTYVAAAAAAVAVVIVLAVLMRRRRA